MKELDADFLEEKFHAGEKKLYKKIRKLAQSSDRSLFKKTNLDQSKRKVPLLPASLRRGRVLSITPEGALVEFEEKEYLCSLKGSLKKERTRLKSLIAVGDFVHFSYKEGQLGHIAHIEERFSFLSRAEVGRKKQQVLAVNIDQVLITLSVVSPPLPSSLAERYILSALKGQMTPILVINKIDLLDSASVQEKDLYLAFCSIYPKVGVSLLSVSAQTGEGMEKLKDLMKGKASVFSGPSGVGKSSLIQAISGQPLKVGELSGMKGAHTTSHARLISLEEGGFCIDTPGIQTLRIWELKKGEIGRYFPEFLPFASQCKYPNCLHIEEPYCAVRKAVEEKLISSLRFESYRSLIKSSEKETFQR